MSVFVVGAGVFVFKAGSCKTRQGCGRCQDAGKSLLGTGLGDGGIAVRLVTRVRPRVAALVLARTRLRPFWAAVLRQRYIPVCFGCGICEVMHILRFETKSFQTCCRFCGVVLQGSQAASALYAIPSR